MLHHRIVAKDFGDVAHELIHVSFAMNFLYDALAIVVPQATAEFLVVHSGLVLLLSPHFGYSGRLKDFELVVLIVCPLDEVCAVWIDDKLQEELPELDWSIT